LVKKYKNTNIVIIVIITVIINLSSLRYTFLTHIPCSCVEATDIASCISGSPPDDFLRISELYAENFRNLPNPEMLLCNNKKLLDKRHDIHRKNEAVIGHHFFSVEGMMPA